MNFGRFLQKAAVEDTAALFRMKSAIYLCSLSMKMTSEFVSAGPSPGGVAPRNSDESSAYDSGRLSGGRRDCILRLGSRNLPIRPPMACLPCSQSERSHNIPAHVPPSCKYTT